jgi:hypothetical protein
MVWHIEKFAWDYGRIILRSQQIAHLIDAYALQARKHYRTKRRPENFKICSAIEEATEGSAICVETRMDMPRDA